MKNSESSNRNQNHSLETEVLDPDQVIALDIIDAHQPGTKRSTLYTDATIKCKDQSRLARIKGFIDSELERRGYPASAEPTTSAADFNAKFHKMMDMLEAASKAGHERRMREYDELFARFSKDEEKSK